MKRPGKALSGGRRRPVRSSGRARPKNSPRLRRCRLEFLEPRAMLSAAAVCDHLFYSAVQQAAAASGAVAQLATSFRRSISLHAPARNLRHGSRRPRASVSTPRLGHRQSHVLSNQAWHNRFHAIGLYRFLHQGVTMLMTSDGYTKGVLRPLDEFRRQATGTQHGM
jgi:hypothetical protein